MSTAGIILIVLGTSAVTALVTALLIYLAFKRITGKLVQMGTDFTKALLGLGK